MENNEIKLKKRSLEFRIHQHILTQGCLCDEITELILKYKDELSDQIAEMSLSPDLGMLRDGCSFTINGLILEGNKTILNLDFSSLCEGSLSLEFENDSELYNKFFKGE